MNSVTTHASEIIAIEMESHIALQELNAANLNMECMVKDHAQTLSIRLLYSVLGMPDVRHTLSVKYPASGWDSFKLQWFPEFMKSWFPVKYSEVTDRVQVYKTICPHVSIPENMKHFEFMVNRHPEDPYQSPIDFGGKSK